MGSSVIERPGEVHDAKVANQLIAKISMAEHFIADKGYDSEAIREQARTAGMNPVIPRKSNSKKPNPEFDSHLYKLRNRPSYTALKLRP